MITYIKKISLDVIIRISLLNIIVEKIIRL